MRIVPTIKITNDFDSLKIALKQFSKYNIDLFRFVVIKNTLEEHLDFIQIAQKIYKDLNGNEFKLMLDIPCPKDKLRLEFYDNLESVMLKKDEIINIYNFRNISLTENVKSFYVAKDSFNTINKEEIITIGDYELLLKIIDVNENKIKGICINNATVKKGSGIATSSGFIKLTDKNITEKVLKIINNLRPEICVLSYIENENDILDCKKYIQDYANYNPYIMSKIECQKAFDNIKSILNNSDSIMIARGCLAVNVGIENLVKYQEFIIKECYNNNKNFCIASNILRTLGNQNWPSRSDIADLIYMIKNGANFFVITDGYCMTYKFDNLMYILNKCYSIYSR